MAKADIKIEIMNTEFDAVVEYDYSPAVPAKLDALPEDCYPAEPEEFDFQGLVILDSKGIEYDMSDMLNFLGDGLEDDLIEAIKESE